MSRSERYFARCNATCWRNPLVGMVLLILMVAKPSASLCHLVDSFCICGGTNTVTFIEPRTDSWQYSMAHCPEHHCTNTTGSEVCPPQPGYTSSNGDFILVDCCAAHHQTDFLYCPEPPEAYPHCHKAYRPSQPHANLTQDGNLPVRYDSCGHLPAADCYSYSYCVCLHDHSHLQCWLQRSSPQVPLRCKQCLESTSIANNFVWQ